MSLSLIKEHEAVSTFDRYAMPSETDWVVPSGFETAFRFEYEDGRAELLNLYPENPEASPISRSRSSAGTASRSSRIARRRTSVATTSRGSSPSSCTASRAR